MVRWRCAFLSFLLFCTSVFAASLPQPGDKIYIFIPPLYEDGTGDISLNILLARSFVENGYAVEFLVPTDSKKAFLSIRGPDPRLQVHHVLDSADADQLPTDMPVFSVNNSLNQFSLAPWLASRINFEKSVFLKEFKTPWPFPLRFPVPALDRSALAKTFNAATAKKILDPKTDLNLAIFGKRIEDGWVAAEQELATTLRGYATALRRRAQERRRPSILLYRKPFKSFPGLGDLHNANFFSVEIRGYMSFEQMSALLREAPDLPFITSGALWPLSLNVGRVPLLHLRTHFRDDWLNFLDGLAPDQAEAYKNRAIMLQFETSDLVGYLRKLEAKAASDAAFRAKLSASEAHHYREGHDGLAALLNERYKDSAYWYELLSQAAQLEKSVGTFVPTSSSFSDLLLDLGDRQSKFAPKNAEAAVDSLEGLLSLLEDPDQAGALFEGSPAWQILEKKRGEDAARFCELASSLEALLKGYR